MPKGSRCILPPPVTGTARSVAKSCCAFHKREGSNLLMETPKDGVFSQCSNRSQQNNSWVAEKRKIKSVCSPRRASSCGRNSEVQSPEQSKIHVLGTRTQHLLLMDARLFKYPTRLQDRQKPPVQSKWGNMPAGNRSQQSWAESDH